MATRKKAGQNGKPRDYGLAADAAIAEAIARKEREAIEGAVAAMVNGNRHDALGIYANGLREASLLDDGKPRDYGQALAAAVGKTIALEHRS